MEVRVEYRRGHAGVASRDDTSQLLEAETLMDAIPAEVRDWPTIVQRDGVLYVIAPDDTSFSRKGKWEHYVTIEALENEHDPSVAI